MEDKPKLLDAVRAAIRIRHYSGRTEETRHPAAMGADEVNAFLSALAVEQHVSAVLPR